MVQWVSWEATKAVPQRIPSWRILNIENVRIKGHGKKLPRHVDSRPRHTRGSFKKLASTGSIGPPRKWATRCVVAAEWAIRVVEHSLLRLIICDSFIGTNEIRPSCCLDLKTRCSENSYQLVVRLLVTIQIECGVQPAGRVISKEFLRVRTSQALCQLAVLTGESGQLWNRGRVCCPGLNQDSNLLRKHSKGTFCGKQQVVDLDLKILFNAALARVVHLHGGYVTKQTQRIRIRSIVPIENRICFAIPQGNLMLTLGWAILAHDTKTRNDWFHNGLSNDRVSPRDTIIFFKEPTGFLEVVEGGNTCARKFVSSPQSHVVRCANIFPSDGMSFPFESGFFRSFHSCSDFLQPVRRKNVSAVARNCHSRNRRSP
mmetsp:Transcript_15641/g.35871  ORF Transcript_15641/g.35871 Transcript_15641/m.35871 type:complete len:372 (-) Transcript_15641:39-1154(-)